MLLVARVVAAEAAGGGGEQLVDGGRVGGGDFSGDVAHAVGALDDRHSAFGERPPVPLFEGDRFQPDHQPQQPGRQLFGAAGLRRRHRLLVDRGEGVRFADAAGYPIDRAHLLGVKLAVAVGLPDGGQIVGQPA